MIARVFPHDITEEQAPGTLHQRTPSVGSGGAAMRGLSLFTGVGGIDLAFEAAGGTVAAMCECDEFCRAVLTRHWPNIPLHDDVRTLRGEQIGPVDIIYGGFPCQPFSLAGSQKGKSDDRYLWPEFSRLVREIEPAWVVAENVPGILNLAADDICEDLERQGYAVGIFCYEAAALGALHRRARVFFVAHAKSDRRGARTLQRERGYKTDHGEANHQAARPGESPGAVPYSGRGMFERGSIAGTVRGEWEALQSAERCCGRSIEPGVGGMADGFPAWLDRTWWRHEPDIPRVAPRGVLHRAARLKALGNAVVPAQIYPIFKAIMEIQRTDIQQRRS